MFRNRFHRTTEITEFIRVAQEIKSGLYLLTQQTRRRSSWGVGSFRLPFSREQVRARYFLGSSARGWFYLPSLEPVAPLSTLHWGLTLHLQLELTELRHAGQVPAQLGPGELEAQLADLPPGIVESFTFHSRRNEA